MKNLLLSKLIVLFALALSSQPVKASHFAGGDLQYVYIGDSTGVTHQYLFILRLYRDVSGIPMPNNVDLHICSSCFNTTTINLPQFGPAQLAPTLFDCVDPNAPGTVTMEVYEYRQVGTLPGLCSDFVFMTQTLNARNNAIDNLNMASGSSNLIITAELNNFFGHNSSPKFVSEPVRAFCVGKQFNWKQSAIEPNGDSIYFNLIPPKGGPFNSVCSAVDYAFNPGWSYTQPISTMPGTSLTIDPQSGIITFTPSSVEVDVLAVSVDEYRLDTVYGQWVHIGSSTRDMQITVSPTCSQQAQMGVALDTTAPGIYIDPVSGLPTIDYNCLDSAVVMHFLNKLDCSSISPDGTDFRLTGPNGQPIPIKEIASVCDVNNETKQLLLKLNKPLVFDGYYYLYSKIGNDGNTLLNKCGFPMDELDTIQLFVDDCQQPQMDINNVTIVEDQHPKVEFYADTATFKSYLFDHYMIYRAPQGGSYTHVGNVYDPLKTYYDDLQIGQVSVDQTSYSYKVEMVLDGNAMGKTRDIHSILLKSYSSSCDSLDLEWNAYNGWQNAEYTVMIGSHDGTSWNWSKVDAPGNPTASTKFSAIVPMDKGQYKLRVETIHPSGNFMSMSNWVDCSVQVPIIPPAEVSVPNVITPNGDGINEYFEIDGIESYQGKRYVAIHNRWGTLVYENDQYSNSNAWSGRDMNNNLLADGVYFYTIDLFDQLSGTMFKQTGAVTTISN